MKVLELNSIAKEKGCIYYINRYSANAVIEVLKQKITFPISFTIEVTPFGAKTIEIDELPRDIEYPTIPLCKSLKEYITILDRDGSLPQT